MINPHTTRRDASLHIVTDSFAHRLPLSSDVEQRLSIVPNRLIIGDRRFREGVDLNDERAVQLILQTHSPVCMLQAPSVADYLAVLQRLTHATGILIITPSRELSLSWEHARAAALQVSGMCPIMVVDSRTLSCAQGMLVDHALEQAVRSPDLNQLVQRVRLAVERIYIALYLDSMSVPRHSSVLAQSHAVLGSMLGVRPLLTVENGQIITMEKVRTRAQGLERLIEFVSEFADIERAAVFSTHGQGSAAAKDLKERLSQELPGVKVVSTACGPSLAALVGTELMGIVIVEKDKDNVEVNDEC